MIKLRKLTEIYNIFSAKELTSGLWSGTLFNHMAAELDKLSAHYKRMGLKERADNYARLAAEERKIFGPETFVPAQETAVVVTKSSEPTPQELLNFYIKRPVADLILPSADQLVVVARTELKDRLGRDVEVPNPPDDLFETLQGFAERGILRFDEAYYFPGIQLKNNDKLWKRKDKEKPEIHFWKQVQNGNFPSEVAFLEEGWHIGDRRRKPMHGQDYGEDDFMRPLMAYLRATNRIKKYYGIPDTSRFGAIPQEIEEVILPMFAEISGAKGKVRNRRYIEFNVRGNMIHPEWGETNTWEWFGDSVFEGHGRLVGGHSGGGGLAFVGGVRVYGIGGGPIDNRESDTGFSPVVAFPSKPR